jgi:uncharacterized protein YndB with AHSA1/START domain
LTTRTDITVQARTAATRAEVYRLLADGATWPVWTPIGSFRLEREGREGGQSAGAIRVFGTGRVHSREELIELRPDESISYTALSGLPVRDHRALVELSEDGGVTTITWREEYVPKVPGTGAPLRWFLRHFVQRCADGLAAHAERAGTAG